MFAELAELGIYNMPKVPEHVCADYLHKKWEHCVIKVGVEE